jgi:hypothetical protein
VSSLPSRYLASPHTARSMWLATSVDGRCWCKARLVRSVSAPFSSRRAGAQVIGTIRSSGEKAIAEKAGAYEVASNNEQLTASVRDLHQTGIDHSVEVAFRAKIEADLKLLNMDESIASDIPFWPMVFKNIRLFFLGSDDFPKKAKMLGAQDLNSALEGGGQVSRFPNEFHSQRLLGLTKV